MLVQARLRPHLMSSTNFSQFQFAYRQGHCTETALLDFLDNVYTASDENQVTVLIGLNLSTAFDTVCHQTLLQMEFGVSETALSWIRSYLTDSKQFVKLGQYKSPETKLEVGIPQGSVLEPLLFAVYCSPAADVRASHGICHHQYANNTQLHLAMRADNTASGLSVLAACTANIKLWFMQNGLH